MIEHSPDITELAKALHSAQGALDGVKKDAVNPHFRNKYASLESVIDTARPALQANGLSFTQAPGALVDGAIEITTMLLHASGQWLRSTLHVPLTKRDAQGVGSALTYGQRYSLMAVLGLPPVDDDGEEASKPAPPRQERPALQAVEKKAAPQGGAAGHLIEMISHTRNEAELQRVTKAPANVELYERLDQADQDRIYTAIQDQRAGWTTLRAG